MRRFFGLALLVLVAVLAWRISGMLSSDAIGMAIGMALGVLAGVPTAALVLLARRRDDEDDERWEADERSLPPQGYGYQPPVIVLTGGVGYPGAQPAQLGQTPGPAAMPGAWPPERRERSFRLVGENEQRLE